MNSWSEFAAGDYMKAADIKGTEPILTIVGFGDNPENSKGKRVQLMVVKTSMGDSIQIKEIQLNGGAAPVTPRPGGNLKGDAYAVFKKHNTGVPAAEQGKKFVADLAEMFPGLSPQNLTDANFEAYIRSFDAAAPVTDSDLPF